MTSCKLGVVSLSHHLLNGSDPLGWQIHSHCPNGTLSGWNSLEANPRQNFGAVCACCKFSFLYRTMWLDQSPVCMCGGQGVERVGAGGDFYGFNQHFLDAWAEVYRELRWKRQEPDMEELKCQQTHLLPPPACGLCVVLWLSSTQARGC